MIFGVLKDIKEGENRVICTPVEVASIIGAGHTVLVQEGAGVGAGLIVANYLTNGAVVEAASDIFTNAKDRIMTKTQDAAEVITDAAEEFAEVAADAI